jgi:hypothetical protein
VYENNNISIWESEDSEDNSSDLEIENEENNKKIENIFIHYI